MTRFVETLESVSKQTGAGVLVVHHAIKQACKARSKHRRRRADRALSRTGCAADESIGDDKEEAKAHEIPADQRHKYLSAMVTKNNYAAPAPPVFLRRITGGFLVKADLAER